MQLGIGAKKKARKSLVNHSKKAGLKIHLLFLGKFELMMLWMLRAGTEINIADIFATGRYC